MTITYRAPGHPGRSAKSSSTRSPSSKGSRAGSPTDSLLDVLGSVSDVDLSLVEAAVVVLVRANPSSAEAEKQVRSAFERLKDFRSGALHRLPMAGDTLEAALASALSEAATQAVLDAGGVQGSFRDSVRGLGARNRPQAFVSETRRPSKPVANRPAPEASPSPSAPAAWPQGEAAKLRWVQSGEVIPALSLADAWGITPQALSPAEKRGALFSITVKNKRFFPREFLVLTRERVESVCRALEPLDAIDKLIFWKQVHGALGGKTVAQALAEGRKEKVLSLAGARAAQAKAAASA